MIHEPNYRTTAENPYPHFPLVAVRKPSRRFAALEIRRGPNNKAFYIRTNHDLTIDSWMTDHTPESLLNINDGQLPGRVARYWKLVEEVPMH